MILNGQFVDNTVVGGPAYNSKRISRGDFVLKVNQLPVNDQNVLEVVAGDDTPGSIVQLAIAKGGRNVFPHFNISMFMRISDYILSGPDRNNRTHADGDRRHPGQDPPFRHVSIA